MTSGLVTLGIELLMIFTAVCTGGVTVGALLGHFLLARVRRPRRRLPYFPAAGSHPIDPITGRPLTRDEFTLIP